MELKRNRWDVERLGPRILEEEWGGGIGVGDGCKEGLKGEKGGGGRGPRMEK